MDLPASSWSSWLAPRWIGHWPGSRPMPPRTERRPRWRRRSGRERSPCIGWNMIKFSLQVINWTFFSSKRNYRNFDGHWKVQPLHLAVYGQYKLLYQKKGLEHAKKTDSGIDFFCAKVYASCCLISPSGKLCQDPETVCSCIHQVSRHGSPVSLTYPEGSGGHSAAAPAASEAFAGGASEVMAAAEL